MPPKAEKIKHYDYLFDNSCSVRTLLLFASGVLPSIFTPHFASLPASPMCLRCIPYASQLLLFCVRAASMPRLCCFLTASKSIIICISASASVSQRRITIARFTCPSIEMLSRPHLVTLTRPIIDLNPTVEVYVISRKSFFCISSVCFFVNNY